MSQERSRRNQLYRVWYDSIYVVPVDLSENDCCEGRCGLSERDFCNLGLSLEMRSLGR
jgi:hypothetical protein